MKKKLEIKSSNEDEEESRKHIKEKKKKLNSVILNKLNDDECTVDEDGNVESEHNEDDDEYEEDDDEYEEDDDEYEKKEQEKRKRKLNQIEKESCTNKINIKQLKNNKKDGCEIMNENLFENRLCKDKVFDFQYKTPISSAISFKGVPFSIKKDDTFLKKDSFLSSSLPSVATNLKYLRLSMDNDLEDISPKEIIIKIMNIYKLSKKQKKQNSILNKINIKGIDYSIEYSRSKGDEIIIDDTNTKNTCYIGDKLIGRVYVHKIDEKEKSEKTINEGAKKSDNQSTFENKMLNEHSDNNMDCRDNKNTILTHNAKFTQASSWQSEQSFISWHKNILF